MIVAAGLAGAAALLGPHAFASNSAAPARVTAKPVAIPEDLQSQIRARCALLQGPEYHECIYEVLTQSARSRPAQGKRPS